MDARKRIVLLLLAMTAGCQNISARFHLRAPNVRGAAENISRRFASEELYRYSRDYETRLGKEFDKEGKKLTNLEEMAIISCYSNGSFRLEECEEDRNKIQGFIGDIFEDSLGESFEDYLENTKAGAGISLRAGEKEKAAKSYLERLTRAEETDIGAKPSISHGQLNLKGYVSMREPSFFGVRISEAKMEIGTNKSKIKLEQAIGLGMNVSVYYEQESMDWTDSIGLSFAHSTPHSRTEATIGYEDEEGLILFLGYGRRF